MSRLHQSTQADAANRPETSPDDPSLYLGRDLSWLAFNRRVLAEAENEHVPLLERVRFLAIAASNLDEFFMKRVGLLKRRLEAGVDAPSHDGMTVRQQLDAARVVVDDLQRRQAECFESQLKPALAAAGIRFCRYADLGDRDRRRIDEWFRTNVFPVLTPLAVDPGHRFPFISNLSISLGVLVAQPDQDERLFARLKIPGGVPGLLPVPHAGAVGEVIDPHDVRLVPLEDVIANNLDDAFAGMRIIDVMPFRVTRSAGVEQETEDSEDLLEHVESALRQRRFAEPVRLETEPNPSNAILDLLVEELDLNAQDVYSRGGPLDYDALFGLTSIDRPDLKDSSWVGVVPPRLADDETDIFTVIRERDVLVHHPYESFHASVERFIAAAARDPNVLAIKQTLYRTSRDSPFVDSLIRAAEEGKQVACLVELRARFDEDKNVRFARQLEKHGVHVAYGVVGLKTHCKCSLVVRREADGLRTYAHIGTGNYHPGTAQQYTDFSLLTCDPAITEDCINVFNYLTGRSRIERYNRLIVAPFRMRDAFYEMIDREIENAKAGKPARIMAKMNQLEDRGIIQRLILASQAGVKITLIVRGFCCLRPGVPGVTENIRIRAFIGRFLEHSRLFHFANGFEDPIDGEWYLGSADWMSRNLDDRVEIVAPVNDPLARSRILRVFRTNLADRANAWELREDGAYARLHPRPADAEDSTARVGTFAALCRDALSAGREESLENADPDDDALFD